MKFQLSIVFVLVVLATLVDLNSGLTRRQQVSFAKKAGGREEGDFCFSSLPFWPSPCGEMNTIENEDCCGSDACCEVWISDIARMCTSDADKCK